MAKKKPTVRNVVADAAKQVEDRKRSRERALEVKRVDQVAAHRSDLRNQGIDPDVHDWGENPIEKDRLAALEGQGVEVQVDHRGRVKSATKADVWSQMLAQGRSRVEGEPAKGITEEQYAAVRRLEADMIKRAGLGIADLSLDRVDRSGDGEGLFGRMCEAGARVDDALRLAGPPAKWLLEALVGPNSIISDAKGADSWRDVVLRIMNEANPQSQSGCLRMAAMSLAAAYPEVDRLEKERERSRDQRVKEAQAA